VAFEKVLGPNIRWKHTDFVWAKIVPPTPLTAKRPCLSPLVLPPSLSLKDDEIVPSLKKDLPVLPGLNELFMPTVAGCYDHEHLEELAETSEKIIAGEPMALMPETTSILELEDVSELQGTFPGQEFLKMDVV
jgi:hypothetical protein